jgi:DNA-binding CsgD family transcriptional regulator/catechol 2,3-dioxygenase-like lactoylglutathione lyase family enzyme
MVGTRRRGRPKSDDVLTPAEWRVAHAVKHGMTNRAIAERRGISIDAVKFHVANIIAKLGVKNRKELRQWFRAPKASALSRRAVDMNASLSLGPVGQIARTVKDLGASEEWYRKVLGLPHLYTFGDLAFFDCGGTRLMLTQQHQVSLTESLLYWRVDDIVLAHQRLQTRGVEFVNAPHMIHKHTDGTEEWMAFFKDLEGRLLAIMSQVKAGPA